VSALEGISIRARIALGLAGAIMLIFFAVQTCIAFEYCPATYNLALFGYVCVIAFMPPFFMVVAEFLRNKSYTSKQLARKIREFEEFQEFVQQAALVSIADEKGRITFANQKFQDVSGYNSTELVGKDHVIVNSDQQPKGYWGQMYKTVHGGEIWNDVVTNKNKDGDFYYVDTYIKASRDDKGKVTGYLSIRQDVSEIVKATREIEKKNTYLEHAAKILRHDMHSGINTYIPRGVSSLERRMPESTIEELKIQAPLKMIKEGLAHAQKVYRGVYEFTNLVKKDATLNKELVRLDEALRSYLASTSYGSQVSVQQLPECEVNEALFCTAIDNLIRNGLRYNDSDTKRIDIFIENGVLMVQDNGRGMTQEEFEHLSKPYTRKEGQKESGTGLGLNITIAILEEHGFSVGCEKNEIGTKFKIGIR
jgi:PAS domain S-box-containing protein